MNSTSDSSRERKRQCPVCPDLALRQLRATREVVVDYCDGCGGLWCDRGEADALRNQDLPTGAWSVYAANGAEPRCHGCHADISRDDHACANCGRANVVDCPACSRPMDTAIRKGIVLDVCGTCAGVWFDASEFAATRSGGTFGSTEVAATRDGRPFASTRESRGWKDAAASGLVDVAAEFLLEAIFELFSDW